MAANIGQKPVCPVDRNAKVIRLSAAYQSGLVPYGPPVMPGKKITMIQFISIGVVVVGLAVFLILVFIGSESFGPGFVPIELVLVILALLGIIGTLILSFFAFTRITRGDLEAQKEYGAWDSATAIYNRLYYCPQDNIIFDPQTNKVVPPQQLNNLIESVQQQQHEQAQSTLAHK
ncbi:MAG TPA: hypothetical protein VKV40_18120 [Ktedonobacteraceae bacterium]|nr:hypothetical protein [Ktedonobacteraceae bacterium]